MRLLVPDRTTEHQVSMGLLPTRAEADRARRKTEQERRDEFWKYGTLIGDDGRYVRPQMLKAEPAE